MATTRITASTDRAGTAIPRAPQQTTGDQHPEVRTAEKADTKHGSPPKTLILWDDTSRSRRARLQVGVEFDGHSLVLTGVRRTRKRNVIERLHVVRWDEPPSIEDLAICLRKFVPRGRPGTTVVVSAPRAMVRYFHLPPVAKRHRYAAALWEGQKLLPFPLEEENALVGLDFERDGKNGWWTTLVAIPREDSTPILDAIDRLGWPLNSVSLRGTQPPPETPADGTDKEPEAKAVVLYSRGRGSFTVFRNGRLRFHYDLGMIPEPPSGTTGDDPEWEATAYRAWIEILGSLITDPFEFCLSVGPDDAPRRLELVGFPEAILPLVTDWNTRFPSGVTVIDPLRGAGEHLPDDVAQWLETNSGLITPSFLAAGGRDGIDCTPSIARRKRRREQYARVARAAFLISLMITATWSAFNWVSLEYGRGTIAAAWDEHRMFRESPAVADVRAKVAQLAGARERLAQIHRPPTRWMPWIRTALATLPDNAALTAFEVQRQKSPAGATAEDIVYVRIIGSLSPDDSPHALTYREWMRQLAELTDPADQPRLQERPITWKGQTRSTFSIEMNPTNSTVTGGRR